jgi:hypothetical protein
MIDELITEEEAPRTDFYINLDAVEALDVSHGVTPDAPKRVWL